MADLDLLNLLDTISQHDDHAADLTAALDGGRAVVYIPSLVSLHSYAGVVTEPSDELLARCGDVEVQFVVRPRIPMQRTGAES